MPVRQPAGDAMTRLLESAEFEQALRSASRARTAHFAAHHVSSRAAAPPRPPSGPLADDLSTTLLISGGLPVEDLAFTASRRLGAVVPKRHARRAVTRSLLKRQIYAAASRHVATLATGVWVVRLRAPFDRGAFPSASSRALRGMARNELDTLFRAATSLHPS